MTNRILIQLGGFRLEHEGDEKYSKDDVKELLKLVEKFQGISASHAAPKANFDASKIGQGNVGQDVTLSTSTIAQKIDIKTGPDLVLAASAYLTLGKGLESFSRQELLGEMKNAKAYYKTTYSGNLSRYLATLIKSGNLNQVAGDNYTISAKSREEIGAKIAE
jgi:hypothetical protein